MAKNNKLRVFINGRWINLRLAPGAYEVKSINEEIERLLGKKGQIEILPDLLIQRAILTLKEGVKLNF